MPEKDERQIRAMVLALPSGAVEAEASWTVHDRHAICGCFRRALSAARPGDLELGDATLELKPFLRLPGPLLWLEMDPQQKFW